MQLCQMRKDRKCVKDIRSIRPLRIICLRVGQLYRMGDMCYDVIPLILILLFMNLKPNIKKKKKTKIYSLKAVCISLSFFPSSFVVVYLFFFCSVFFTYIYYGFICLTLTMDSWFWCTGRTNALY